MTGDGSQPRSAARLQALDGIRAFAVLGVMLFHFGVSWAQGGLLGVDVFFVLSGFLITTLLCREYGRTGTVALRAFWARRARRLVPGLLVLLLGVALYAHVYASSIAVTSLRKDALATLLYVANWRYIVSGQGYFALAQAPSALLHTWTLGIEEQYYLLWPLIAVAVLRWRGARALAWVSGLGAVASALEMGLLYAAGFSVNRLYYGTDTRAQALLVGSFLAALGAIGVSSSEPWRILPAGVGHTGRARRLMAGAGLLGAAVLFWAGHSLLGTDRFLYRGGFLVVALAAGAVIGAVITGPETVLARVLSLPPLVFIGRISYGLYLYHWPLFLVINNAHTGLSGFNLLAARFGATFAAATISWFAIETPIRRQRRLPTRWFAPLSGLAIGLVTGTVLVATTVPAAPAPPALSATKPNSGRPNSGQSASGLPSSEASRLRAAHAFTTKPMHFLLLGDSVALTLGLGLSVDTSEIYGVHVNDRAAIGCDLDPGLQVNLSGAVGPATPGCRNWPTTWATDLDQVQPEVVGLLLGRWEVADHLYRGQWTHVGQPLWDAHLEGELNQAVRVLSSHGARVVLFTMPYVDPAQESPAGVPFSENQPSRVRAYNALVRAVARRDAPVTTLIDLNRLLDPDGQFEPTIKTAPVRNAAGIRIAPVGDVTVRSDDGIHISVAGGEYLRPFVMPTVADLGLQDEHIRATAPAPATP